MFLKISTKLTNLQLDWLKGKNTKLLLSELKAGTLLIQLTKIKRIIANTMTSSMPKIDNLDEMRKFLETDDQNDSRRNR